VPAITRRAVPALALIALIAAAPLALPAAPAHAAEASAADLAAAGETAVTAWMGALVTHDPEKVKAVLAPEFQIQRSDGGGYSAADYLDNLPQLAAMPTITGIVATGGDDLLVVRYEVVVDEVIDGKPVEREAPRLTVFRRDGDAWLVVAHANFARIEQ
jgi:hypothetical protein